MKYGPLGNAFLLIALGKLCEGRNAFEHKERNLKLQCAPGITNLYDDQGNLDIPESRFAFLSFGNEGRRLIDKLRRRDDSYYQTVIDQIIMGTCDVEEKEMNRCVPSTSEFAAKDWNNNCIQAEGYSCGDDMCESTSNCFWAKVEPGKVRKSRFPKEEYAKVKSKYSGDGILSQDSYIADVATLTIAGIAVSIALLVLWFIYFIGRYFCCCLWTSCRLCKPCSPIPRAEGYNVFLHWIVPGFLYFGGFIGITLSGCIAIIGNEDISVAATGCFAYIAMLIDNLGMFLISTSIPLNELKEIVASAAVDAFTIFDGTEYVRSTANEIINSFVDFMDLHILGLSGNEQALESVKNTFSANVEPVVDQIQGMLDTLETDLYEGADMINETLSTVVSQIGSFKSSTDDWLQDTATFEQSEGNTRTLRQGAILSLFVIGATICLAGFIGIISSRRPNCKSLHYLINLTGIFSAFLGSGCLVIASFTLLISFVWHDTCEISRLVVQDFEPILGETIALGVNAIFDGDNLAMAFNVTDKIDFEEKLNEGLAVIETVNITDQFQQVLSPLKDIEDDVVNPVKDATFSSLKSPGLSGITVPGECTFDYQWRRTEWDDMTEPWMRATENNGPTSWSLNSTGYPSTFDRVGDEGPEEYINRIYSIAGKCEKSAGNCCLNNDCSLIINDSCNSGSDCKRNPVCSQTSQGIRSVFEKWHDANRMSANLGAECPAGLSCPTQEFKDRNHNDTLISLVDEYGENITNTAESLINIANTTVGTAMTQVRIFLCNMNISFVANGYNQVRDEVCETMLGGFSQINWGLWALGFWLEVIALIANILATRLRGYSKKEASLRSEGDDIFKSDRLSYAISDGV